MLIEQMNDGVAEVQPLAIIDELTGIYNYRGLVEPGNREGKLGVAVFNETENRIEGQG